MKFRAGKLGTKFGAVTAERDNGATTTATDGEKQPTAAVDGSITANSSSGDEQGLTPPGEKGLTEAEAAIEHEKSLQFGVQVAKATLQVWSRNHLIAAYIL